MNHSSGWLLGQFGMENNRLANLCPHFSASSALVCRPAVSRLNFAAIEFTTHYFGRSFIYQLQLYPFRGLAGRPAGHSAPADS